MTLLYCVHNRHHLQGQDKDLEGNMCLIIISQHHAPFLDNTAAIVVGGDEFCSRHARLMWNLHQPQLQGICMGRSSSYWAPSGEGLYNTHTSLPSLWLQTHCYLQHLRDVWFLLVHSTSASRAVPKVSRRRLWHKFLRGMLYLCDVNKDAEKNQRLLRDPMQTRMVLWSLAGLSHLPGITKFHFWYFLRDGICLLSLVKFAFFSPCWLIVPLTIVLFFLMLESWICLVLH